MPDQSLLVRSVPANLKRWIKDQAHNHRPGVLKSDPKKVGRTILQLHPQQQVKCTPQSFLTFFNSTFDTNYE